MSAEIIPFDPHDFLWKLVERDVRKFINGEEREMEGGNIGRAIGFRLFDQIPLIRECWAEARKMKAEDEQAASRQREGA